MQSSVAAAAATLGNLKLGDSKAHAWSFDNFIDGVNSHRKDLSWRAVAECLDIPGFFVSDGAAFLLLVRPTSLSSFLRGSGPYRSSVMVEALKKDVPHVLIGPIKCVCQTQHKRFTLRS